MVHWNITFLRGRLLIQFSFFRIIKFQSFQECVITELIAVSTKLQSTRLSFVLSFQSDSCLILLKHLCDN